MLYLAEKASFWSPLESGQHSSVHRFFLLCPQKSYICYDNRPSTYRINLVFSIINVSF
nr:MAG TPA: hypothetical protein [Caudoviricetes sp.]